uniref:Bestrophin homolog n=1 Tax=Ditylenchus dipsaci TaxID=166011 RepID=A0A915D481_9BILA
MVMQYTAVFDSMPNLPIFYTIDISLLIFFQYIGIDLQLYFSRWSLGDACIVNTQQIEERGRDIFSGGSTLSEI